jgi:hypothetical protein
MSIPVVHNQEAEKQNQGPENYRQDSTVRLAFLSILLYLATMDICENPANTPPSLLDRFYNAINERHDLRPGEIR